MRQPMTPTRREIGTLEKEKCQAVFVPFKSMALAEKLKQQCIK